VVAQADLAAGMLLDRINDAGVEGPRVEVQADGPFPELAGVAYVVYRVQRIDSDRICGVDLNYVSGHDGAAVVGQVFFQYAVVLHGKPADRGSHPAVLVFVVVDR